MVNFVRSTVNTNTRPGGNEGIKEEVMEIIAALEKDQLPQEVPFQGFWSAVHAYRKAREFSLQYPVFTDVIWCYEVEGILRLLRNVGVESIILTSNFSGMLDTLALMQSQGCTIGQMTQVYVGGTAYDSKSKDFIKRYDNGIVVNL